MQFRYTAKKDGSVIEGLIEAQDKFEVYRALRAQNMELINLEPVEPSIWSLSFWNERLSSVKDEDKILFAENLATMIMAGLSLSRALQIAQKQTKNPKFKRILRLLATDIERGETLHSALAKYRGVFSDLFISMVRAGELSGNLPESLKSVAKQMERVVGLKKKIKGAMIYPSIILFAIFGIGAFMMVTVVPTLSKIFKEMDAELPATTQFIIAFSDFLTQHYLISITIFLVLTSSMVLFLKSKIGHRFLSKFFLTLPIIGEMTREINAAYASRTLASLLRSGVDIVESTKISADVVQNDYFKDSLRNVAEELSKGKTFSEAVRKYENLYPIMFIELIAVGEETGVISDMFAKVAEYYEEEVNNKTKNLSTIVEPFLMLFIGIAVGFFAVAMLTPMYSITQNM